MNKTIFISVFLVMTALSVTALSNPRDNYIGDDFRDVSRYANSDFPEARTVMLALNKDPQSFFGPTYKEITTIYGVELYAPVIESSLGLTLPAVILVQLSGRYYFRKVEISFKDGELTQVKMASADADLTSTHFVASVGIYERKVILEDRPNHIKIIYPLGLGGVDDLTSPGEVKFSTPQMTGAFIQKKYVIEKRTEPAYYRGMPFLDISQPKDHQTEIAFHIEINDTFRRSFESHGCMRLRQKDLMEFFNIVMHSSGATEVSISLKLPSGGDHPFPLQNKSYDHYKNFGTNEKPATKRSKNDHLVIMETVYETPPWLNRNEQELNVASAPN